MQVRYKGDSKKADAVYDGIEPLTAAGKPLINAICLAGLFTDVNAQ